MKLVHCAAAGVVILVVLGPGVGEERGQVGGGGGGGVQGWGVRSGRQ